MRKNQEQARASRRFQAIFFTLLIISTVPAAATTPAPPGDHQVAVEVKGQKRSCLVHVPRTSGRGRLLPLVIALHGARGNGEGMAKTTGFSALADQYGFIAAYPNGMVEPGTWNSLFGSIPGGVGITADEVDDVAFVRSLIGLLRASCRADPRRVFVCGHSAGAYMAYRLAVELSDQIAAAGIVNGSLGIKSADGKPAAAGIPEPLAPVSVIHICGKNDGVVKFQGAQTPKNLYRSVPDCVQMFIKANECNAAAREIRDPAHGVVRTLYGGGRAETEVELVVVESCGHEWPAERHGLSASRALLQFFSAHPKSASK